MSIFREIFEGTEWEALGGKIVETLRAESVLVTSLPEAGQRFFMNYLTLLIREKNEQVLFPFYTEILSQRTTINSLKSLLLQKITQMFAFKKNVKNIEQALVELCEQDKSLIVILNRFEKLVKSPDTMSYLESLRGNFPRTINFLVSCDINCITNPGLYLQAGMITSSNVYYLPQFREKEIKHSIAVLNKYYNWNVPESYNKLIYSLSGGVSGLIKYTMKYIHSFGVGNCSAENIVAHTPALAKKLHIIMKSLSDAKLLVDGRFNYENKDILKKLGVIDEAGTLRIDLLAPLLSEDVLNVKKVKHHLTIQEEKIFNILSARRDEVVSLDEISFQLWGSNIPAKYSMWALYKSMSKLNKKLKKYNLAAKNYRNRGYQLKHV